MADFNEAKTALEAYRFFDIKDGKEKGDRLLEPWILLLTIGRAGISGRRLKRFEKQLAQFFARKEISEAVAMADPESERLLYEQLLDSARNYLRITVSDPGYNSSLFGLIKLKDEDRERKLAADVHKFMQGPLLMLDESPYRAVMMRALHRAFLESQEDGQEWFDGWRESLDLEHRTKLDSILQSPEAD